MPYIIDYNLIQTKYNTDQHDVNQHVDHHYIELIVKMIHEYQGNFDKIQNKQDNHKSFTKQQLYTIFENKYIYQDFYKYSDKFIENFESSIETFIQNFCKQI